jgi:NAD(P)H dehydrogenase (quinone)
VNEYLNEILQVPIISLDKVLESDCIFLGSPTYFGNVSAESCLRSINAFGKHLGMINIPMPSNLVGRKSTYAYGLFHNSGSMGDNRLDEDCKKSITNLVDLLVDKSF